MKYPRCFRVIQEKNHDEYFYIKCQYYYIHENGDIFFVDEDGVKERSNINTNPQRFWDGLKDGTLVEIPIEEVVLMIEQV